MATQENIVKRKIKEVLDQFPDIYRFMPVQMGYGAKTLDYILCIAGVFIAIEAKAPGKEPTPLQDACIRRIKAAGGKVFVIDGTPDTDTYTDLHRFLTTLSKFNKKDAYNPAWTYGE